MSIPTALLGDVVSIKGGGTPSKSQPAFYTGDIPWVTPKDMKSWDIVTAQDKITEEAVRSSATSLIPENAILIVNRSGILKHTLPVGINRLPVAINQDIKALICGPLVEPDYLARMIKAAEPIILGWVRATTADNFPIDNLRALEIPLPALEGQRRIAAILDQADSLRRLRQRGIDRLNSLGRAVYYEMFGDPVTNSLSWKTTKLGEIGTLARGMSKHRPRNDPILLGGKYPLIQTGDVSNADGYIRDFHSTYSEVGLQQSRLWPRGTLCITIAANIGKTAILDIDACFPDSVVGFSPGPNATTEYVQYWLSFIQEKLEKDAPQSAQKNINLAILSELEIPLPPRELQSRFSQFVLEIDLEKRKLKRHLDSLTFLFSSLQHRAFRGEL